MRIIFFLLLSLCFNFDAVFSQEVSFKMNTAERILQKIDTTRSSRVVVNKNNFHLRLEKKHIKQIMKVAVFETYGKREIRKEKPWNFVKIGSFWIVYGTLNKYEIGGVFEIVVNSRNGAVEHLIHGK